MTMGEEVRRMARAAKRAGADPEKIAPTKSDTLREIFMKEYERFQPRKTR